jgi:hypothetical protein
MRETLSEIELHYTPDGNSKATSRIIIINFMEQSPSWEANSISASQEFPPPPPMEPEGSVAC